MSEQPDYSVLDQELVLRLIFYPRRDWSQPPPGAKDYLVPVEGKISISCRFYPAAKDSPCILFFHGNGEVACDYDWIAPAYNQLGISLFVADYRGYGRSNSLPNFSSMARDARPVFDFFRQTLHLQEHTGPLYIMGRSLGTTSAIEIAHHYAGYLTGLIVESGCGNMPRLLSYHGFPMDRDNTKRLEEALVAQIASIKLPALIIHGEVDELIPPSEATSLYNGLGSKAKRLVVIPGVGHNDIMLAGDQYFAAIKQFVFPQ